MPGSVVLAVMLWQVGRAIAEQDAMVLPVPVWIGLLLTPFLIAFGEEAMFRGVLLRRAITAMPVAMAMFLSAISFAAFHFLNGLNGGPASDTFQQVAFAFIVGFALAPIALRLGNLWPLIIWHGLWNATVFASQVLQVFPHFALTGMAIQAVVSIWLWTRVMRVETRA